MTYKSGIRNASTTYSYKTEYSGGFAPSGVYEGPWTNGPTVLTSGIVASFERSGDDDPRWREHVRQGANVTHAYNMRDMQLSRTSSFSAEALFWRNPFWKAHGTYRYSMSGVLPVGTPTYPSLSNAQSENQAKTILAQRANAAIHSLQGGVTLGELTETLHQIRRPAQGMRKLFGDYHSDLVRGKRFRRRRDKRKYLRDSWLETQLGIKPLLMETKAAGEALARIVNGTNPGTPIRSYGKDQAMVSQSGANTLTNGPLSMEYFSCIKDFWRSTGWGTLREEPGAGTLDILGLSTDQFWPTVWELIPYSFVVDYFTNVGNGLAASCFNTGRFQYYGLSFVATRQIQVWATRDVTNKTSPAYISSSVSPGETVLDTRRFGRIPTASLTPAMTVYGPKFATQFANVAALIDGFRKLTPY